MKIDWEMFLLMWLAIIAIILWVFGMGMTLASENVLWLLLWIPAAIVSTLLSCTY